MSIISKVDWLRGFLESLEHSDAISKRQIQLLKEKLNLLLEEIEKNDTIKNQNMSNLTNTNSSEIYGDADDLPF